MNPSHYRIHLPHDSTVTVSYHRQTFPLARKHAAKGKFEAVLPKDAEARIVPGKKFLVEAVHEGVQPVNTEVGSSPSSPPQSPTSTTTKPAPKK